MGRDDRAQEAEFRKLAQVATAWELLLTKVGGDIGKGNAITTIVSGANQMLGADLSCKAVGSYEDGQCLKAPIYTNVVFGDDDFWSDDPERIHPKYSWVTKPYIRSVNFRSSALLNLSAEELIVDRGATMSLDVIGKSATQRCWMSRLEVSRLSAT